MTPSDAILAKENGINSTAHFWIAKIELDWDRQLATGRDTLWIDGLDGQVPEVVNIVVDHFLALGFGLELEECHCYADTYPVYRLRIEPLVKEPGLISRLLSRIFGGSYDYVRQR